jgi:flavin reductase (DIM6/NTAB) family NADH-FMN oxidoreductase RutF
MILMHSYTTKNGQTFHYDSDIETGEVIIVVPFTKERISDYVFEGNKYFNINLLGEDILEFIAYCYIQRKCVSEIENMNWKELFK